MFVRHTCLAQFSLIVALGAPWALAGCDNSLSGKCKRGDGVACGMLGDQARAASSAQADQARACDFYRKACAAESYTSCGNLGALLGQGTCRGAKGEALAVLERACTHDDLVGCNNLGMLLSEGTGDTPKNVERAVAAFRKACPRAAVACDNLGSQLIETDEAGATAAFRAGCESKDDDALAVAGSCYKLGLSHEHGLGIPVDKTRAKSLYSSACSKSVPEGCYHLGLLELAEETAATSAAGHFQKACDLGVAPACNNLGLMYSTGKGVAADPAKALECLQRGCDGGELRACANVGSRYVTGDGVAVNEAKGRELLARACAGGVTEACRSR